VSLQLQALRKFLGAPLFERPPSGFRLTPAGERLRRYAEEALGGLRTLQQDVASLQGSVAGRLDVGLTDVMNRYVLPSTLSRFLGQFPGVEAQIYVEFAESMFSALLRNRLDVGCFINVNLPPGLTVETLFAEALVVFVSPHHPLARRRRVAPDELSRHPFVTSVSPPLRTLMDAKLRSVGVTPRVTSEARHPDAIKTLVEHDGGYSMLVAPAVASELASGQLLAVRLDGPPIRTELVAEDRSGMSVAPIVRRFIDFIRAQLVATKRDGRDLTGASPRSASRGHGSRRRAGRRRRRRA